MERVIIVGAGFGGLAAARALAGAPVDVTVVDRHNYHLFQPLLYQVATAALDPQDIAHAVRGVLRARNVRFRMATVTGVDLENRMVVTDATGPVPYDHLVLAAGASTASLGVPGTAEHAFPLKSLADATTLRDHILGQFERADADPSQVAAGALSIVVVGAGPTGIELCGALVELFDHVLARDFPALDLGPARVVLVEAMEDVLGEYGPSSRAYVRSTLRRRGVEVRLGAAVAEVGVDRVSLADGTVVPTRTVVWTAGVRAPPLADALALPRRAGGRIAVGPDLSVPGHPEVSVVGDLAGAVDPRGRLLPQMAPVAIQQGRHAARQLARRRAGLATEPFRYRDRGTMATVGRHAAVAELPPHPALARHPWRVRLTGTLAWLAWLGLHLVQLIGFRNRASVLVNWLWSYVTYDRAARLIVRPEPLPGSRARTAAR